jgi:tetrahydrodipicolinate N-succinyltransferase
MGKPIFIGEDCWIGGNVIVLPGVSIGKGSTIGAGSIVTKVGEVVSHIDKLVYYLSTSRSDANGDAYRMYLLSMWLRVIRPGLFGRLKRR